ncbi:MAG: M1 family metallopeptidase [Polaribacter sp.]|nr:M1 family metallopeptidase [Polaribacter sp.]MDG1994347.1 M1 family metallopeptidase [Polaribacter sp.]
MKFKKFTFIYCLFFTLLTSFNVVAQLAYKKEKDKLHALQHTKLSVSLNFENKELNGEAWLTLKTYFYATNKVVLDAKAMLIHQVQLNNKTLGYNYDQEKLIIELPRFYKKNESFTLYIKYTARPEKVYQKGSNAIKQAKGLYFINADGLDKNKPTQVWTQGETEASSCWFPTIDSPNQKTTQEISITVPNRFKTLSNGQLKEQTNHANGTRTDYWSLKQKHAPYLFFLGVGEFEIIKDSYKEVPVEYYVEKKYAAFAKDVFGLTPEMMAFFSKITGIEYPWSKYSQFVARDYVSGAMENTTAVVYGENANQMPGQLVDENKLENTIAHELFHHWFGNLVTAESWSNLTLNESFANYSEYLWRAYKYGEDDASAHLFESIEIYKSGLNFDKNLVRFYYENKEDLFDAVSYNKGGLILHMLKNYVGKEAFYASLNLYLTENKYKSAEVHQLRLAFEKVTGKDLNWFFNQWYFGSGHPKIQVSYDYNTIEKKVTVNIYQTEGNFQFPLAIDIIENGISKRKNVFINNRDASFIFDYNETPENILINADGVLLADITEPKTTKQYLNQLKYTTNYAHKIESILALKELQSDNDVFDAFANALSDSFYKIRILALENIDLFDKSSKRKIIDKIKNMALKDPKTLVRAAAIETLGKLTNPEYMPIFQEALKSKSYSVLGKTLVAIYYIDKTQAIEISKKLPNDVRKIIATPLTRIFIQENNDSELEFIAQNVLSGMFMTGNNQTQELYKVAFEKIAKSNNAKAIENLVKDLIAKGIQFKQFNFDKTAINLMQQMVNFQKNSNVPNKNRHIQIIRTGIAQLVN